MSLSTIRVFSVLGLLAAGLAPSLAHAAAPCSASALRWASSSNRIYVTGDVSCTLTEIRQYASASAPLTLVDPANHVWLLGANIYLENGATLLLHGSIGGGDVDQLRLRSNNATGTTARVEIRAQWGTIDIRSTQVTSWNESAAAPDTEYTKYGRAFIRAISYLVGSTPRESTLNIVDSDVGYLGYYAAESYGLAWKVRGTTSGLYDLVEVGGDVINSTIHHNYFGMYTYGAYGMNITDSEFYSNIQYGVDPHDDSDSLLVEDNYIHHNGNHGFICSQRCDNLTVRNNTSSFNTGAGFMLHRAVVDTVVEGNVAASNTDAGFAIFDSYDNILRGNTAQSNKYGIRLSVGSSDNSIEDNVFSGNTQYGIYMYLGSDAPTINDGRPARNTFSGNEVSGGTMGIKATAGIDNAFVANTFAGHSQYTAYLMDSSGNTFEANELGGGYVSLKGASACTVADSDTSSVLIGADTAEMAFTDSAGRVLQNDDGLPTLVAPTGTSFTLTRDDSSAVVDVQALELRVSTNRDLTVEATSWTSNTRTWTATTTALTNASFTIGGLVPGGVYELRIGSGLGGSTTSATADTSGNVVFATSLNTGTWSFSLTKPSARSQ